MKKQKEKKEDNLSWENVEKFLHEKTTSGNALAIIETEKIFSKVLEKLKFPGKTIDQKFSNLNPVISNFKELSRVREIYKNLISNTTSDYSLENLDIKKILTIYYKAIEDVTEFHKSKNKLSKKIKIYFNYYKNLITKNLKKIGLGIIIFFFLVFLLDSTDTGQSLVSFLVSLSHFIFSWVLFTVLLVGGIVIIIIGSFFYFDSRKKKKAQLRVEE